VKKSILLGLLTVSVLPVAFAIDLTGSKPTEYVLAGVNVVAAVFILLIAMNLYKFVNITKKHPAFMAAYFLVGLLLFTTILNVLYFFAAGGLQYLPIYFIDRLILLSILVVVYVSFKKFEQKLGTKN